MSVMAASLVVGCSTAPPPLPMRQPPSLPASSINPPPPGREPAPAPVTTIEVSPEFRALPGWEQEDHLAGFQAYAAACLEGGDGVAARVCRQARRSPARDSQEARRFFETHFTVEYLPGVGVLTGYFMPVFPARRFRDAEFNAPVRPKPGDLGRAPPGGASSQTYPDRAWIDKQPAADALSWMRPEDLFFMQIQGSGVLAYPDGGRQRAIYDGSNGAPFQGIATPMQKRGLISPQEMSADGVKAWLAAHRGSMADEIMRLDRRYVFFRLQPDDGADPMGASGRRLPAGRALAIDPAVYSLGDLFWIDATTPMFAGSRPVYRRLALALDTGGAIKGPARADLYLGRGADAGAEAGRIRHDLRLYRLSPIPAAGS